MTLNEHLLDIGMEECAEIAQRISKALRFGMTEVQPGQDLANHERIRLEFRDLVAALHLVDPALTAFSGEELEAKQEKILKWVEYAKERGTIREERKDEQRKEDA